MAFWMAVFTLTAVTCWYIKLGSKHLFLCWHELNIRQNDTLQQKKCSLVCLLTFPSPYWQQTIRDVCLSPCALGELGQGDFSSSLSAKVVFHLIGSLVHLRDRENAFVWTCALVAQSMSHLKPRFLHFQNKMWVCKCKTTTTGHWGILGWLL